MLVKLVFSLMAIVVAAGVAALATIASISASDGCGGCDTTPVWAEALALAVYVAFGIWLVVALASAFRTLRRRRRRSTTA